MVIVGLDIGQARIGVAVSDESEVLASPRALIRRRSNAAAIEAIVRVVRDSGAQMVVVGLPISYDGELHAQALSVQAFGKRLRGALTVPLVYADETLSTVRAEERLRAAGVRPDRLRERVDAAAAAIILQDYLDQRQGSQSEPERQPEQTEQIERAERIDSRAQADTDAGPAADASSGTPT